MMPSSLELETPTRRYFLVNSPQISRFLLSALTNWLKYTAKDAFSLVTVAILPRESRIHHKCSGFRANMSLNIRALGTQRRFIFGTLSKLTENKPLEGWR